MVLVNAIVFAIVFGELSAYENVFEFVSWNGFTASTFARQLHCMLKTENAMYLGAAHVVYRETDKIVAQHKKMPHR